MSKIKLRKIKLEDKKYFAKWWRDKELLKLTSGRMQTISDQKVEKYFSAIFKNAKDHNFIILLNKKVIGHITLAKRRNDWYETQIIIGEKQHQNKGRGTKAIQLLIKKSKRLGISKIYLEVRPTNARAIKAYKKCGFQKTGIKKYPKNKNLSKTLRMELGIQTKE